MGKRTEKVGVVGKYGTRYGASLRKQVKKIEVTQHAKYTCAFCGKDSVEASSCGHLEVQELPEGACRRSLDHEHKRCCDGAEYNPTTSRNAGVVIRFAYLLQPCRP
eukprot:EC120327.1.p1 GENE.EC120327.1~~EC120327.1.p1  ORF type:complete len:106 (+),score=8.94 EC120327.1:49-366(+)